jgi:protein phosphatase
VRKYHAAAASDRGKKRGDNQDYYGYSLDAGIFVVCDGMGGVSGGALASHITVDTVLHSVDSSSGHCCREQLEAAIRLGNREVYRRAQVETRYAGMGTTLVAMAIEGGHVWVANIGDSRCYRFRHGTLEQLTQDHSLVEAQIQMGRMTAAQAERSPLRNVITRAVGTQSEVVADITEYEAELGDIFLLASDGLTKELGHEEIRSLMAKGNFHPATRCLQLVAAANQAGGRDNITCLIVQVIG